MNFLHTTGITGDSASTPDAAALDILADIDLRIRVAMYNWSPQQSINTLLGKWDATGQLSYVFSVNTNGTLRFNYSSTGSNTPGTDSTVATGFSDGSIQWIRATRTKADGVIRFYTASGLTSNPAAADFTQLGTDVISNAGFAIFASTSLLRMGGGIATQYAEARIYRAQVRDGVDGTLVFDADFSSQQVSTISFTESSSNAAIVTMNGASKIIQRDPVPNNYQGVSAGNGMSVTEKIY